MAYIAYQRPFLPYSTSYSGTADQTQEQLVELIGVSFRTANRWVSGGTRSIATLAAEDFRDGAR